MAFADYRISDDLKVHVQDALTDNKGKHTQVEVSIEFLDNEKEFMSVFVLNHNEIVPLITTLQKIADDLGLTF